MYSLIFHIYFSFFHSLHKDWENYFQEEYDENLTRYKGNENYTIKSLNAKLYVVDCKFFNVESTSIYYDSEADSKLLVLFSSFVNCSSSFQKNGGAIFFYPNGECVLDSVCCVEGHISDSKRGLFCYIFVSNLNDHKNYIIDCSVANGIQLKSSETIWSENGEILMKGINMSQNANNAIPTIHIVSRTMTSSIIFCTLKNNSANEFHTLLYQLSNNTISHMNFLQNIQNHPWYGLIVTQNNALLYIQHSCMYGNNYNMKSTLIYAFPGTSISVSDCSIVSAQKDWSNINVTNSNPQSFLIEYEFLVLDECKAAPESWGNMIAGFTPTCDPNEDLFDQNNFHFKPMIDSSILFLIYSTLLEYTKDDVLS